MVIAKSRGRAGRLARTSCLLGLAIAVATTGRGMAARQSTEPAEAPVTLDDALQHFFSGRYEPSATTALSVRASEPDNLATYDVRTSALHFQLRRAMGEGDDRSRLFKACAACPDLVATFMDEFALGRAAARARVTERAGDEQALFFLGKLDLNYVWLKLGTLGQRTGWNEYWEARRSLDRVLKANPQHTRARVARAWIDYIVDTKPPRGFRWILGGGNRKRALATLREVAGSDAAPYDRAEAVFALWEMEQRERNVPAAIAAAQQLAREFPENQDVAKFLSKNGSGL